MAVFTIGGRKALAQVLLDMNLFLAVGVGNPDWDNEASPSTPEEVALQDAQWATLTDLENKVGITRIRDKFFVKPDVSGEIPMSDGSLYAPSDDPTPYVYLRYQLDLGDASGITLRECGLYLGTQIDASVPVGQMFVPSEGVTNYGSLVQIDRFPAVVRDGSISQIFSTILTM
ncbi:hypothetical protein [Brucella tritici]|uniref:Uncharacterized protein n=1 Tax=Brucella tritici TaxID=94626 RepID=A0A6L3YVR0_9HYPH|nr:hypothetical protein [Brucella tritici]KAB2689652.1 hypothetical protein F9L08_03060 [Brucella tritici]